MTTEEVHDTVGESNGRAETIRQEDGELWTWETWGIPDGVYEAGFCPEGRLRMVIVMPFTPETAYDHYHSRLYTLCWLTGLIPRDVRRWQAEMDWLDKAIFRSE